MPDQATVDYCDPPLFDNRALPILSPVLIYLSSCFWT